MSSYVTFWIKKNQDTAITEDNMIPLVSFCRGCTIYSILKDTFNCKDEPQPIKKTNIDDAFLRIRNLENETQVRLDSIKSVKVADVETMLSQIDCIVDLENTLRDCLTVEGQLQVIESMLEESNEYLYISVG